jgi:hypothetical protein
MTSKKRARLFDEFTRTDQPPGKYSEDSFSFHNRVAGPAWERIRDRLDTWYTAFPDDDGNLLRRFRSPDPRQHFAAWWELYLHAVFTALGFELTVHPTVPGSKGHPDFLVEHAGEPFYLEGATVSSGVVAAGRRARLEAEVQDVINTIDAPLVMVTIQYDRVTDRMPRKRDIVEPIKAWLATLDADELLSRSEPAPYEPFTFGEWEVQLRPIPFLLEARGCPQNQLIGSPGAIAGFTNDVAKLRSAILYKRKHYGTPDKPLVIAVLALNGFVDNRDVENALFGNETVQVEIATGATRITRSLDGVWIGKRGPAAKRMSALLMGVGIVPRTCATAWPRLWQHFDPSYPLEADLPFSTVRLVDDELVSTDATRTASDVLGLPADWPGPEPLFPRCAHRPSDHQVPPTSDREP